MKSILIATDFSTVSRHAASYGVELAKSLNTTAILFNACEHIPQAIGENQSILSPGEAKGYYMEKLSEDARLLTSIHHWPVLTSCRTGHLLGAFNSAIVESTAALVILGMKKDRKGIQRVLGSTVTALIGQLDTPLLIVPEEINFSYIYNIAVAISKDILPDQQSPGLDTLRDLAERFHSKIFFVQVTHSRFPENNHSWDVPFQLTWIKQKLNTEFERITGEDIPSSLTEFVTMYNINMLVILARRHSLFKRFIFRSNSRTLSFECPVPLLLLPGTN